MSKNQSPPAPRAGINQILARLPDIELARLRRDLKPVSLKFKLILCEANQRIVEVVFPNSGVLSAVTVMRNGTAIEAANIGKEGLFGANAVLAHGASPHRVIVQVPGEGLQMGVAAFKIEVDHRETLHELLLRYNSAFLTQVSQSVACNGLHSIYQRCCRWILMSHDRVQSDEIPLTHEFLAVMIGVRRAGVTEVLISLSDNGLIRSKRGVVTILNRQGLEGAACECYRTVTDDYDRLFAKFPIRRR